MEPELTPATISALMVKMATAETTAVRFSPKE
jgi:hypothetical protein